MAETGQNYGAALPDQVEQISTFFESHLELISDVRELYKDKVALEREYAAKLQVLTKKAIDRKSKLESSYVLGNDPTKAWDESVLKRSTLNAAYDRIIESMVLTADDHVTVADALSTQVVDVLKLTTRKNDEYKKKEMQFFQKLIADRDRIYAERVKAKQKYDEECGDVDLHRQKQGRAHDDRHAGRIARQADQQRADMLNSKNSYIISIAVANKMKGKFYSDDLPDLENQLQVLQTKLVSRTTKVLLHAQAIQTSHLDVLKGRLVSAEGALSEVSPSKDQALFIDYNIRPFVPPGDWKFEPCATFYDTEDLNVDPAPKVFLQNKLTRSQSKLKEIVPLIEAKRREVEQFSKLSDAYETDRAFGNVDDISESYMDSRHQLVHFASSECILNAEIDVIMSGIGDDIGTQKPHNFKSSSFSIPTTCGYCNTSIWGLSKQGKTCKACNLSVHSKCELKVPADCANGTISRTTSLLSRKSTNMSRSSISLTPSVLQTPTPSSFVQSPPEEEETYPVARVIFDFVASSEFELSVQDGTTVNVLEPDDGSGWVKVSDMRGNDGLVPATYLAYGQGEAAASTPTPKAVATPGSGEYVKAIYKYTARGSDELSLNDGETIELSRGPTGGKNFGEGWWEGFNSAGQKGIFPSNYVAAA